MNFTGIFLYTLTCWLSKITTASQCKAASYSVQDHVLINHVIKAGPAELIEHCISRCIEHTGCHSSNFYRISKWCELNDKTHASHPEDMRQVPFTNYMENTLRPLTCNKDSECGKNLICFLSKCIGEQWYTPKVYIKSLVIFFSNFVICLPTEKLGVLIN